jgi:hypothetical protein
MKTYYKGKISYELCEKTFDDNYIYLKFNGGRPTKGNWSLVFSHLPEGLKSDDFYSLFRYIDDVWINNKLSQGVYVDDENAIRDLDRATKEYHPSYLKKSSPALIFEKIVDENGNIFAKELITGVVFPFGCYENVSREYYISKGPYRNSDIVNIKLVIDYKPNVSIMDKCCVFVDEIGIADNNEINWWQRAYKRNKKRKSLFKELTELANKNVFNSELIPIKKRYENRNAQNPITITMENIEYLLQQLKLVNEQEYLECSNKYNNIISGDNCTRLVLAPLEAEIEFYLKMNKKNVNNINEYLDLVKTSYLKGLLYDQIIEDKLELSEVDEFEDMFLKAKDSYSPASQRKVLKDLAFIYLLEVYTNIETIEYEYLENSYFSDNLKTIYLLIQVLRDLGIINVNISIDIKNEIDLATLLSIIKSIEFNKLKSSGIDNEDYVRKLCMNL